MKTKIVMIAVMLSSIVYLSSCNKDKDELSLKQTGTNTFANARLNSEMTNEEMEADINLFINKLDTPSNYPDMNFEEAFEYVEATLNYKYVDYDYSKCAYTMEFNGSVQISVNNDGNISMSDISATYNTILDDWKTQYHSISETQKTPIVFDITEVTNTTVNYTMIVGYGYLDLSKWDESAPPPSFPISFIDAAYNYSNKLKAFLNNNQVQYNPSGTRAYSWTTSTVYISPDDYPSNPSTATVNPEPLPPLTNGYTDDKLFKSVYGQSGYHRKLNAIEYNYHWNMNMVIMLDVLSKDIYSNFIPYIGVKDYGLNPNYYNIGHYLKIVKGYRYWTIIPPATL